MNHVQDVTFIAGGVNTLWSPTKMRSMCSEETMGKSSLTTVIDDTCRMVV